MNYFIHSFFPFKVLFLFFFLIFCRSSTSFLKQQVESTSRALKLSQEELERQKMRSPDNRHNGSSSSSSNNNNVHNERIDSEQKSSTLRKRR